MARQAVASENWKNFLLKINFFRMVQLGDFARGGHLGGQRAANDGQASQGEQCQQRSLAKNGTFFH
jgi:hypothetical protein